MTFRPKPEGKFSTLEYANRTGRMSRIGLPPAIERRLGASGKMGERMAHAGFDPIGKTCPNPFSREPVRRHAAESGDRRPRGGREWSALRRCNGARVIESLSGRMCSN